MADEPGNRKIDNLSKIAALAMTAVGVISGINTYQISQLDSKISATESKNKWDFKVYDSVVEVVNSKDSGKILAVKIMVEHVASEELKKDLIAIVNNELEKLYETEEVGIKTNVSRAAVDKSVSPQDETGDASTPSTADNGEPRTGTVETVAKQVEWGSWDLDIFWCESSGAGAKAQADQLKYIIQEQGAKGRIRSRILPDVTNARPGYRVKGYQIRPNDNEIPFANEVRQFATNLTGGDVEIEIKRSAQNTPWYLSLFICPESKKL